MKALIVLSLVVSCGWGCGGARVSSHQASGRVLPPAPLLAVAEPTVGRAIRVLTPSDTPDRTYAHWYQAEPRQIVEPVAFEVALLDRGWPHDDAERMTDAAEQCESPAYQDGKLVGIDLWRTAIDSDGHETVGPGIHLIAHPGIQDRHDLTTLAGTADALTEIREDALRIGWTWSRPWGCIQ